MSAASSSAVRATGPPSGTTVCMAIWVAWGACRLVRCMSAASANTSRGEASAMMRVCFMTTTRSTTSASSGMSWDTHTTVVPSSRRRRIRSLMTCVVRWSCPVDGSSRMRIAGCMVTIEAIPTSLRIGKLTR